MFVYIRITRPIPALELVTAERRAEEKGPKQPVFIANAPQASAFLSVKWGTGSESSRGSPASHLSLSPRLGGWVGRGCSVTGGHGFSAGLALGHKRKGNIHWKYPLSPAPAPSLRLQWLPPSCFSIRRRAVCMVAGGTLGSSAEEGGSGVWTGRHLVFQAVVGGDLPHRFLASFLGSRPAGGASGIRVHSSHCHRLSHVASRPDSCPVITNGALCSQDKERIPYPNLARAGLACPDLGLRRCHFQEEALRRRDGRACPAGGGICLLVWGVGGGGGVGGVGW